jgi:hypothetical protein
LTEYRLRCADMTADLSWNFRAANISAHVMEIDSAKAAFPRPVTFAGNSLLCARLRS